MNVSLIRDNKLITLQLPEKIQGQYWLQDVDDKGDSIKIIGIEASENKWYLKSNKYLKIVDQNDREISEVCLEYYSFYKLLSQIDYSVNYVYSEPSSDDRYIFTKYGSKNKLDLTIGREKKNKLVYDNPFVSSVHATLSYDGIGNWCIVDEKSSNGTFVNGRMISEKTDLFPGDVVYILGLRIIIGSQYIAINNPDNRVELFSNSLVQIREQIIEQDIVAKPAENSVNYYFRSPKFKRGIQTYNFKVDSPPTKESVDETPMAFVIGPSMTMGMASVFTALSSIVNYLNQSPLERNFMSILPTLAMAVGMLAGTVLWPILTKKSDKKRKLNREKNRKEKYIEYLNECRQEIQNACNRQRIILIENNPSVEHVSSTNEFWEHDLWSREYGNDEFLNIRIGVGNIPLDCNIKFPEKSFSLDDDDLKEEVYKMEKEDHSVTNVPILHSLWDTKITGVASNNRTKTIEFLNNVIMQLAMFHSYDELKIVLIANSLEISQFQYAKWLPHLWNNEKSFRYIASTNEEIKELSLVLEKDIEKKLEDVDAGIQSPHYVVIITNKDLAYKADFISKIVAEEKGLGFSLLYAFGEMKNLPKECSTVIEISSEGSTIYDKFDTTGDKQLFEIETVSQEDANDIAKELSNVNLDLSTSNYILPSMLTFLDMFGVGKIEHLNSLTRWKENNPVNSLKTPVGVDNNGDPFMLDLHEKFHGPHGLIAGMTGSGKSEFIISFILSLAVNYHPDEVSFILIDYKGGGLTGAFESDNYRLPHLAGTITNLDGSAVKRSLVSIQSELRNRQAEFNKARKIANEGTMDIYKYQQLYRNGVVKKPIPHLFIISDEFAELKAQQPDFMDQLISTARIGRSLGVHLILATQKPSGVVDDQIWSNSRFRVCLKVQDKSDSMDMIKRPDAAEISQTGRFYLQVGFNELFELGQSAWSGAPYIPKDTSIEKEETIKVCLLDNLGREIHTVKLGNSDSIPTNNHKQVVEINKYIYDLAKEEKSFAKQLWLDPIPAKIFVDNIKDKYSYCDSDYAELEAVIGEYDDPTNQRQGLLTLQFVNSGNVAVYGTTGSGKGQFVSTMLYSLLSSYDAEELNAYILDFGSEALKAFERAPQVSDVVLISETEKINNFLKLISNEIILRKKLFADYGGSFVSYAKKSKNKIPNIVVVINNLAAFAETYYEYEEKLMQIIREGNRYGIYFVVTITNFNDIRYRFIQNFNKQFVLQQNELSDYTMILGSVQGLYPAKYTGRGLFVADDEKIYEFQTALIADSDDMMQQISDISNSLAETSSVFAKRIPVLPNVVSVDYMISCNANKSYREFAVGVAFNTLEITKINFDKSPICLAVSQDTDEIVDFAQAVTKYAASINKTEAFIFDMTSLVVNDPNYSLCNSNFETEFEKIYWTVVNRHNDFKDNNGLTPEGYDLHNVFCAIVGLSDFLSSVSVEYAEKIKKVFENCKPEFNVEFLICDSLLGVSSYSFEDWYKQKCNGNGVWIGDGIVDQFTLSVSKRTKDMNKELDNKYGFVVNNGKATFVKLLNESEES